MLLKSDYAKFGVSNFFQTLSKKNLWGSRLSLLHLRKSRFNPSWTGIFVNLKRLEGKNTPLSSQMTMKLGKDMLWVEIFTNWPQKGCRHLYVDIYVVDSWKIKVLLGFWLNISKTVQLIFTKLMSFFVWKILKFEDWRKVIHCSHGNQFMRKCWAKNHHDLREEKWHF